MKVLVSAPYFLKEVEHFKQFFETAGIDLILADVEERLSADQLMGFAGEFDGALCGDDQYTAEVIEACVPRLKVIAKWGSGIDSIDIETAMERGIQVRNTPGAFTDAVADTVMSYLLAFARRTFASDTLVKGGGWQKLSGWALHERALGVVGVGRIGKAVMVRARAFGMQLLGNDVVDIDPKFARTVSMRAVDLDELLAGSDFVSLNCDLNPSSYHLIDEARLALMKPEGILVNTSRGAVVDELALIDALRSERIAAAALDVFEVEPLSPNSPLRTMENVLLSPHNANNSPTAWARVHWNSIRHIFDGLGLEPPEESPFDEADKRT